MTPWVLDSYFVYLPVVFRAPDFHGSGQITFPSFFWPATSKETTKPNHVSIKSLLRRPDRPKGGKNQSLNFTISYIYRTPSFLDENVIFLAKKWQQNNETQQHNSFPNVELMWFHVKWRKMSRQSSVPCPGFALLVACVGRAARKLERGLHFRAARRQKYSFVRPEFRTGTLATQATLLAYSPTSGCDHLS